MSKRLARYQARPLSNRASGLGLQPAMRVDGKRKTIGFDVPGGFAQYLRLDADALNAYVF